MTAPKYTPPDQAADSGSQVRIYHETVAARNEPGYSAPDLAMVGEDHVQAYKATDGEVGYLWNGVPTLLLTTVGRRSGKSRTSALIFARDRADYVVIASYGGSPAHPAWYLNLRADENAEIQVKADRIPVIGRTAEPGEHERLWGIMAEQWPNYDVYQTRTDRRIPVVVLSAQVPGSPR